MYACWFDRARMSMICLHLGPRRSRGPARPGCSALTGRRRCRATLIHLGGIIHPTRCTREFTEVNVEGTKAVVTEAGNAGVRRAIVMSSNSPIGVSRNPFGVFDEESPYNPYMGYGRSKQEMEEWLRAGANDKSLPKITIVRAPWFYGPEQPARQTRFFSMIKAGRFPIVGDGHNRRSWATLTASPTGSCWLRRPRTRLEKSTGSPYPMKEIIDTVRAVLRDDFGMTVEPKTVQVPGIVSDVARLGDWMLQKAGLYNQELHVLSEMNLTIACTIDRAKHELGYKPLTNLREGMRRSVAWVLDHGGKI
jgi:nucleoside-diphosphate-sugar epimerase